MSLLVVELPIFKAPDVLLIHPVPAELTLLFITGKVQTFIGRYADATVPSAAPAEKDWSWV
jgi:hypothetical protein